jgi:hypothetical protein
MKRRTYPSKKKDAKTSNAGETPHAGSMGEGRSLRSAWRAEGTLQTSIELFTTLTDGEVHNALRNKKYRLINKKYKQEEILGECEAIAKTWRCIINEFMKNSEAGIKIQGEDHTEREPGKEKVKREEFRRTHQGTREATR